MKIRITRGAEADLAEIWTYVAEDSVENADGFVEKVEHTIKTLQRSPYAGRLRDELGSGVRSFSLGRYLVFYRVEKKSVDILRVLHGARDIGSIFRD